MTERWRSEDPEAISWIQSDWRYAYFDAIKTGWERLQAERAHKKDRAGENAVLNVIDDPRVHVHGVQRILFNVVPRWVSHRKKEVTR